VKNILCFGDSNTWGFAPHSGERYALDVRWTGVLQHSLGRREYRVIEEGLNGRTTVYEEQGRRHRSGIEILPALLESHQPLDLVVVMLGTNDLKSCFNQTPLQIAHGAKRVCETILECEFFPAGSVEVLLVSPTVVKDPPQEYEEELKGAMDKSREFSKYYKQVSGELDIHFFDADSVVKASDVDGVHWGVEQHGLFGRELCEIIKEILP